MKRPKKIYHTHEKEVVNRESGEVISSETVKKTKYLARQFSKITSMAFPNSFSLLIPNSGYIFF